VREQETSRDHIELATPPPELCDVPDANLIIRSSDSVNFRLHKSVLVMVSPVFRDILSLPQSTDSESVDGLPVVQLSEDSELLSSLVSMLYPVCTVVPKSHDKVLFLLQLVSKVSDFYHKVLYLLAACQKYEMASVMSSIRAKVKLGEYPAPKGAEAFLAYAIASGKGLVPEMEKAARQSLSHPLSFEILGEELRLLEGWALRDLVRFRKTAGVAKKMSSNSSSPLHYIMLFLSLWFILALQSFMGQWNIGVNGPNDSDDHSFGQITSIFYIIQHIDHMYAYMKFCRGSISRCCIKCVSYVVFKKREI
jgi:hypothetical protein